MRLARALAPLPCLIVFATPAFADEFRPGYLELTQSSVSQWRMVWKAPMKGGLAVDTVPTLPGDCTRSTPSRELVGGAVISVWTLTCQKSLAGRSVGLSGLDTPFTDALVRIALLDRPVQTARLTPDAATTIVAAEPEASQIAKTYFNLGVEHILTGYDHLLFVLSLVLLIVHKWEIARTVTAFTIAHSITLTATSLQLTSVARRPVEICIALSIVFLTTEIVKARPDGARLSERARWAVAFVFGLLHGLGFAGALAEIGLPEDDVPFALFTFNLGIEAGQLVIVASGLALLGLIRHFANAQFRAARIAISYAIGSVAAFWLIERALA